MCPSFENRSLESEGDGQEESGEERDLHVV